MLKSKIYASGIDNLTDARYFAAWYVNYIGFNGSSCLSGTTPIEQIAAIKEWVDVEDFSLDFTGLESPAEIIGLANALEISTIKLGPFCPYGTLQELKTFTVFKEVIFENLTPLSTLRANIARDKELVDHFIIVGQSNCQTHYLEQEFKDISFFFDLPDLQTFIKKGSLSSDICDGLILKGGAEERVGVKSFDDTDEVLDLLLD